MSKADLKGSIYRRGKQSWRIQLSLGRGPDGKYQVKRETIQGTRKQAEEILARWNVEFLDQSLSPTNRQTVNELCDEWLSFLKQYRKPNTVRFYRERMQDALPTIGHKRMKDISLQQLQDVLASCTADVHLKRTLSAFWGWAEKHGKVPRNICTRLVTHSKPSKLSESDVWSLPQVQQVYAVLDFAKRYDIIVPLGIECGLRLQEILALTWEKLQGQSLLIDQAVIERTSSSHMIGSTKDGEARIVYVSDSLLDKLTQHRKGDGLIISDTKGGVPCRRYIRRYLHKIADRAGVPRIPPKNLRSTHVSLMHSLGVPMPTIQEITGHSTDKMIRQHYLHIYESSIKTAADTLASHLDICPHLPK